MTVLTLLSFLSGAWAAKDSDPLDLVGVPSPCATPTSTFGTTAPFGLAVAPSYGATPTSTFGMKDHAEAEELSPRTYSP